MMLALMTDPRMPQGLPGLLSKLVPALVHAHAFGVAWAALGHDLP